MIFSQCGVCVFVGLLMRKGGKMGERRELPKTQFDQRWETFVERCVCVCVIIKKGTMVGGPAPTIVGNRSPPIFYSPSA